MITRVGIRPHPTAIAEPTPPFELEACYRYCEALASARHHNFPVASLFVPTALRKHIWAIYAFARTADDFADEDGYSTRERLRLLDDWLERLHAAVGAADRGDVPPTAAPHVSPEPAADAIFLALGQTIRERHLPAYLFEALLSAFRQDVIVTHYANWAEVDDYCRRSANPVGRLVLRLFGHDDARLDAWSDAI